MKKKNLLKNDYPLAGST